MPGHHSKVTAVILACALACGSLSVVSGEECAVVSSGGHEGQLDGSLLSDLRALEEIAGEPAPGAEYDGYIVSIRDDALGGIDAADMDAAAELVVGQDVAVVDELEDVLEFASPGDVENIDPNYKLTAYDFPQTDPRDWIYQGISPATASTQWGIKYVGVKSAWQAGWRGQGVNVAVIDSGYAYGHEDMLEDKIVYGRDWVNGGYTPVDDNGHGSLVASIIAAEIDNVPAGATDGTGMAGIADKATLSIHKVLDSYGGGNVGYALNAFEEILSSDKHVDVINLSLGHPGYVKEEDKLVRKILASGTIIVAATGNDGTDADRNGVYSEMCYPAGYDGVIGVGSIGSTGRISDFSTKNKSADVAAPGEGIVGFYYANSVKYIQEDGTSFACPIVAAVAALAKQRDKAINAGAFLAAIKATSTAAGPAGYDTSYGYGILNVGNLVNYLKTRQLTVTFDAAGGTVVAGSRTAWPGGRYGSLPTPTKKGYGFAGWYTKKKGGSKVTSSSIVGTSSLTLYAHWQPGTTLLSLKANKGKLSPAFSYKKTSYKLKLSKSQSATKITAEKAYKAAVMKIKVGSGKYKTRSSVTVKLKKGKSTTVYIKLSKKGQKSKTYKIKVSRKK